MQIKFMALKPNKIFMQDYFAHHARSVRVGIIELRKKQVLEVRNFAEITIPNKVGHLSVPGFMYCVYFLWFV